MKETEIDTNQKPMQTEERRNQSPTISPRTDIREVEDHFEVEVELPGVAPTDVDIQVEGDELRVTAARTDRSESGTTRTYVVRERVSGVYSRLFRLGTQVDRDTIEARMTEGVLRIRLLKHASVLPRRITVS
jgi:HSP20 family protein